MLLCGGGLQPDATRAGGLKPTATQKRTSLHKPAPVDTIFNVASLTKPIVAMTTLRLVSQGKWNLDEPLAMYWVDPDVAGDARSKTLTTRHVLTHTTGFLNWRYLEPDKKLAFHSDPGLKFGYSGEGFEYLGKALEKKFGRPLPELAQSLVFQPAGMTDTHFVWSAKVDEARFAKWHGDNGELLADNYRITTANAADNVMTTAEDYGRFGAWVISGAGLPDALLKDMVKPQSKMGLGWEILSDLRPANTLCSTAAPTPAFRRWSCSFRRRRKASWS